MPKIKKDCHHADIFRFQIVDPDVNYFAPTVKGTAPKWVGGHHISFAFGKAAAREAFDYFFCQELKVTCHRFFFIRRDVVVDNAVILICLDKLFLPSAATHGYPAVSNRRRPMSLRQHFLFANLNNFLREAVKKLGNDLQYFLAGCPFLY
ncbi:MAG: hypothetical protein DDT31_01599 [Syntrophomonadaceae bacterium]|nr:hypothetical protein [Bacillota bacterium]